MTELTTEQRELSELFVVSGKNLLAVVDEILNFSKLEKGLNHLKLVDFSIPELISESTLLLKNVALRKGLSIEIEIDPTLPATLQGDFGLLEQVLKNIVSNAIKFAETGGIFFKVQGLPLQNDCLSLRFEISDSGIGIPELGLSNLFRPFSQIDDSTRRLHGGIGLGLSSSKLILSKIGGQVGLKSNAMNGSLFWFEVPLKLSTEVIKDRQKPETIKTDLLEKPLHILVAEDNLINQVITLKMIRHLGHTAQAAENGFCAVEAVKNNNFDLVLMDCQMPGMDGLEATRLVRKMGTLGKIPVIALTANAQVTDRLNCLNCGVNDFLAKPVGIKAIEGVILKWAKKRQAA